MLENIVYVSMEGKKNFKIGDFLVKEEISLPVLVDNVNKVTTDDISPQNIIRGMIKILIEDPENEHKEYYRDFILSVNPNMKDQLLAMAIENENNHRYEDALDLHKIVYFLEVNELKRNLNIAVCYDEYSRYLFSKGEDKSADKMEEIAFEFYKQVDNIKEKSDDALYYLGRFYLTRENFKKSTEYFEEFLKITKNSEKISDVKKLLNDLKTDGYLDEDYETALEMINSDKDSSAIGYLDRLIKKYPDFWNAYFLKGTALRKMQKYTEAISNFEKAKKLNPESPDTNNEIGLCYMSLNIFHKAELFFSKALKDNPDDINIINNLAVCSYKKGDKQEAINYCKIILEFNPDDLNTKNLKKMIENDNI